MIKNRDDKTPSPPAKFPHAWVNVYGEGGQIQTAERMITAILTTDSLEQWGIQAEADAAARVR